MMQHKYGPDEVCARYADNPPKLTIVVEEDTVFVNGSSRALRFLSELIAAQAVFEHDDGTEIHPRGPGSNFFADKAKIGLYIHRTD